MGNNVVPARKGMSTRRKLAIASWRAPREGNIYGKLRLECTQANAYLDWLRETTGEKVTITHLVGAATGRALRQEPSLNGHIVMGKYKAYDTVDLSFLVQLDGGKDLAQVKVHDMDTKSVNEVAAELRHRAERLRSGEDNDFEKSKGPIKILPTWLLRHMLAMTGFLTTSLGIPAFGQKKHPFGSAIITSVGMLGVDEGFAPPTPFARVPLYVLVTTVRDEVLAINGKPEVRPCVVITATLDHRFVDGYQAATVSNAFREIFDNPWQLSGLDGPPAAKAPARAARSRAKAAAS